MSRIRAARLPQDQVRIHEDQLSDEDEEDTVMDESREPSEQSDLSGESSEEDDEVDENVAEDMANLESTFKGIARRYRLINRIGEGTFSTVYKAEDLHYHQYKNDWDLEERDAARWSSRRAANRRKHPRYVAIKKIYVTSSPLRILNELDLLHDLRNSDSVCPLITAFRHQDQVVAILPYFQHHDFRDYFRAMTVSDIRLYFRSLFTALKAVHEHEILHRDIKPTNFLYHPDRARGVLVDFGLAERLGTDWQHCACNLSATQRRARLDHSEYAMQDQHAPPAYPNPKTDTRQPRRANRAGTRGFRAPEVLFKCTQQTCAIDMWSAGVILLTLLARRFPFFHSADDVDALLELTNIFGRKKMRETALLHGQIMETNIPSYSDNGHSLEKIVLWCTNRSAKDETGRRIHSLSPDEKEAVAFLERLLECDPAKRITAEEALRHPFLVAAGADMSEEDMIDLVEA
ncbi:kinase-like protein [Trichodelitschia bisporula]|uniref:non-specific serine/threonine protein kinase n=1 Tax=Trichodelitschia bisporula TaxID=703511 RepID=A0A6G1I2C7_9PEZI|nr:kinase-like protein [Trichodelitschia bisporula]